MTTWKGFYIKDCGSQEDYIKAVEYAEALGVLRQRFDAKRSFFIGRLDQMTAYFRQAGERKKRERAEGEKEGAGGEQS